MSTKPQTDRRQREVMGVLLPVARYDTQGVYLATGIGEVLLRQLREEGQIKPLKFRGKCFYRGEDLIAMIDGASQ
jgi:hypothetical protein